MSYGWWTTAMKLSLSMQDILSWTLLWLLFMYSWCGMYVEGWFTTSGQVWNWLANFKASQPASFKVGYSHYRINVLGLEQIIPIFQILVCNLVQYLDIILPDGLYTVLNQKRHIYSSRTFIWYVHVQSLCTSHSCWDMCEGRKEKKDEQIKKFHVCFSQLLYVLAELLDHIVLSCYALVSPMEENQCLTMKYA